MQPDFLVEFPGLGWGPFAINREAFSIGPISVYFYGLFITLATVLAFALALRHSKKYGFEEDEILDNFLVLIPTMLIGARLYYVIFAWDEFADAPMRIFNVRDGGLAFYGGVIGAMIGLLVLNRIKRRSFFELADFLAPYIPLGQGIGRWGNFFNQEAFGHNTTMPWGMISNGTTDYLTRAQIPGVDPNLPVHPTFFYEFLGNFLIAALLFSYRRKHPERGAVFAAYIGLYGLLRFFVEGLRTDSLYVLGTGLRASQILSLLMVLAAVVYFVAVYLRTKARPTSP